jgi:hypothetical protein
MMRCPLLAILTTGILAAWPMALARATGDENAAADSAYKAKVAPLITRYCGSCHSGPKPKSDLDLAKYTNTAAVLGARKTWEGVLDAIEGSEMPPKGKPRPTAAEQAEIVGWLQARLTSADCNRLGDPGRVTLRRLNRVEYNNTIRDLCGVDTRPADDFPSDDVGNGFDNIGDVLSLPPILLEKYMTAAEKVSQAAILLDEPDRGKITAFNAADLPDSPGTSKVEDGRILFTVAEVGATFEAKADGQYYLVVKGYGTQAGNDPALLEIRVDSKVVATFKVPQTEHEPGRFEVLTPLRIGKHTIAAAFTNDFYDPDAADAEKRDRNLVVQRIEVQGPADTEVKNLPKSHPMIFGQRKAGQTDPEYAFSILERFATRAYRRPVTKDEVDRLVAIYALARKDGERFERGIQLGVQAALMSPFFLFKVEYDRTSKEGSAVTINDYELATRLSYFLWSTMPDAELMDLARDGKLRDDATLEAQARRLLRNQRKSDALVENFAGQWLQLRNLKTVTPDPKLFPDFDESLRAAMLKESEEYFRGIMKNDRSILEFLDSDYTYLNRRLARFYGVQNFQQSRQDAFKETKLTDGRRGGIITQASVLTVTSNPTRTSPVKRGKYILEQILNTPPPPPPPDVPELKGGGVDLKASLRTRMEQHRADPNCASCHGRMDPLGFGLENFDGIGKWREKDGTFPIDASGTLPSGQKFSGPKGLKDVLLSKSGEFSRCLAEKLLTYGIGRGLEYSDRCAVDRIVEATAKDGHKFSRLVVEIVKSDPFRKRRPKGTEQ